MSRHTKDRKLKRKEKLSEAIQNEKIVFDVISLLKTENTETKPNMAEFFKKYVKRIYATTSKSISFYPEFKYELSRVFVEFLDGHELLFLPDREKPEQQYVCSYAYEDEELSGKDIDIVQGFFNKIFEFRFVYPSPAV